MDKGPHERRSTLANRRLDWSRGAHFDVAPAGPNAHMIGLLIRRPPHLIVSRPRRLQALTTFSPCQKLRSLLCPPETNPRSLGDKLDICLPTTEFEA